MSHLIRAGFVSSRLILKKLDQFHQQFHLCNLLLSNIIKPLICMTSGVSLEKLAKHKLMTILIKNVTVKKTFAGTDQTTRNRVKLRYFDWPT